MASNYEVDIDDKGRTVCKAFCEECQQLTKHYINDVRLLCKECHAVIQLENQ